MNIALTESEIMLTENLDRCYEVVMRLVDEAGKLIAARNSERKEVEIKLSPVDFVTETDKQIEIYLTVGLQTEFPTHKFIGEESTSLGVKVELTDSPTWIIDPIDGTMNFVHGYPQSCISIALYINKIPEIAIVYNPVLNQKFTAQRGIGAFYNGTKMQVSHTTKLSNALVSTDFGSSRDPQKMSVVVENIEKVSKSCHGLRIVGSAALNMSYVAMGASDAHYEFGMHAWDMAAVQLLVKEAGGVFIDPSGGPLDIMSRRVLCASSIELAEELSRILTQYYPVPRDDE